MKDIDLRSDTVTRPTPGMFECMMKAKVGDDVYGDDPSINKLQKFAADMFGFEEALFACSGTQANFVGLLAHCQRGDEYIVGQTAHTYKYEGGGAAVFGSIQPQPVEFKEDGTLDLEEVRSKIKPDDFHFARTRLLCLENTQNGQALPLDYFKQACEFARTSNLKLHLDGARLMNAAVKKQVAPREITRYFDSVSICLSKGLGAPVGSILCGSSEFIARARRWRKVAGGGMRQAGILAAAGQYALQHNIERLAEDHSNAETLAKALADIEELQIEYSESQTNMVFATVPSRDAEPLGNFLKSRGILISAGSSLRLVTHLDVDKADIEKTVSAMRDYFASSR
ncbi:low-specificity L-threonine aldolase [Desulfopila sp. IMCC35008]|uniref:low-specificity L-threonine aldolase n=1 Tax=Desulfopila sp. IMCC35008 TaxID=2653858 RepID=UPI0013D23278|nr:low-specificity L-threonine aldolase [Desulfopila sp. IMCC35008]